MKLTVFVLLASLCLVAVTANAIGDFMIDPEDVELYEYIAQDLAEEIVEIEPQGLFTGMYFIMKKALKTLKRLNCTIKEVIDIQIAAHEFITDVYACGGEVNKKVQNLIDACNDIIETCKDILGINESVCGNSVEEIAIQSRTWNVVQGAQNGHKCFVQMFRKLQTLNKQVKRAVKLIKQIKSVPGDTSKCVLDAVDTLEGYFTRFPSNIKTCSKLVNNKKMA